MSAPAEQPQPLLEILRKTTAFFAKVGIEQPRLDAELLLADALKCKRLELYLRFETPLFEKELAPLREKVKRRARREPLQFILGEVDFFNLQLKVDRRALIPRPETEQLLEILVKSAADHSPGSILDLGTGSGAIALGLAKALPGARIVAVDTSEDALALAAENARCNGLSGQVEFLPGDWFHALQSRRKFDWIVSNPPYLTRAEWEQAAPEVQQYEPYAALVADNDGFAALETILRQAGAHLNDGGTLFLETGILHHDALTRLAESLGYIKITSIRDYLNHPRFFSASFRLPPPDSPA